MKKKLWFHYFYYFCDCVSSATAVTAFGEAMDWKMRTLWCIPCNYPGTGKPGHKWTIELSKMHFQLSNWVSLPKRPGSKRPHFKKEQRYIK